MSCPSMSNWLCRQARLRSFCLCLSALFLHCADAWAEARIEVRQHMDRDSGGWADKASDYAFVAELGACRVQWNAVEDKQGRRSLAVRRTCGLGFSGEIPLHRAILKEIDRNWPLSGFQSIDWGPFCAEGDWAWCEPVARASLQSRAFIDYYQNYPHSRLTNLNGLFVKLANATSAYAGLTALMGEFGVTITLVAVEKVFDLRISQSPFAQALRNSPLARKPKARVMYNAGMAYFGILPPKTSEPAVQIGSSHSQRRQNRK